ncbi:putative ABC transporter ATP-binding protein [Escherichia coli]|uniref:Putative ABC transporter ATP-binding protein n=1 Tax=Escherichia coli TaxID=562 RepID=A0A2X1JH72_ECOLX|nr:putative ABC transporter ATP-binding protein [Escherichia coli]
MAAATVTGLIGANGSGKSTFMKILGGDLEPTLGNVSLDPNERIGKLRQDQFAFEEFTVLDTVIMGHKELWEVKQEPRPHLCFAGNE